MKAFTTRMIGNMGEEAVCHYLKRRFYRLLDRNFTVKGGELDIVAKRFSTLVFVEVKTRKASTDVEAYGYARDAVDRDKRAHLYRAAAKYLAAHPEYKIYAIRFDIAEVYYEERNRKKPKLSIFYRKDAF